jgi:hypothetical protein
MLGDLTLEEWHDWLSAFRQDPWDERRKDDRNAVLAMWTVTPHLDSDEWKPPGFIGPEYSAEQDSTESTQASIARIEELKRKRQLNGQLNRTTSNPTDDGHERNGSGVRECASADAKSGK